MKALLLLLFFVIAIYAQKQLNERPIIGVLTQPVPSGLGKFGQSYIAASYIKYIESAGARAVPVFHNSTMTELQKVFNSINGIFFPGGGSSLYHTALYNAGKFFFDASVSAFEKDGTIWPVVGHCMGHELIAIIASQNFTILSTGYDSENLTLALDMVPGGASSSWFSPMPADVLNILTTQNVTMNNHQAGVDITTYHTNSKLNTFFDLISTNNDRKGRTFVSTWESKKYPIFSAQWHAEKNQFEWDPEEGINHTSEAIKAMQYFTWFLGTQARLNDHQYPSSSEEYKALIYNYTPTYTEHLISDFEQCYFF